MSSQHNTTNANNTSKKIAIVGLANQYPDADTPKAFWQNLLDKRDSRSTLSQRSSVPTQTVIRVSKENQTVFTVIKAATSKTSPLMVMDTAYLPRSSKDLTTVSYGHWTPAGKHWQMPVSR